MVSYNLLINIHVLIEIDDRTIWDNFRQNITLFNYVREDTKTDGTDHVIRAYARILLCRTNN